MTKKQSLFAENKLNVFLGAYGSGKSEVSVNCALILRENLPEQKILLADLDIVNPYYRSADAIMRLENHDIRVISSSYANSNVDVPALPGEMYAAFDDDSYISVFDIGGEDLGANVLGSLNSRLTNKQHSIYMVVNTLRPFTSTPEQIVEMKSELSAAAKLPITGFINNTNLLEQTTKEDVLAGEKVILEASKLCDTPLLATAIMQDIFDGDEKSFLAPEIIPLKRTINYNY